MAPPELLAVDPVAPFDFAVLLGAAGLDVPQGHARRLDRERKRQGKLGAVVALDPSDGERKDAADLRKEVEGGPLVLLAVQAEHAEAGARAVGDKSILSPALSRNWASLIAGL